MTLGSHELPAVILRAGPARASIARRGAECREWSIGGMDLLWPGDPAVWPGVAPILFPVVGWTRNGQVRVRESIFQLGLHGFASDAEFEVVQTENDNARLIAQGRTADAAPSIPSASVLRWNIG